MLFQEFPVQNAALISHIALFPTLLHTISSCSLHPPIRLCFDPLPARDVAAMTTAESYSTVCSRPLIPSPPAARPSIIQGCISILIWRFNLLHLLQQSEQVSPRGHGGAAGWTAALRMGNVPTTVKHCLSYEQVIQDYPWLRRWLLEEKVGVFFLVSNLLHMLCHMTLSWQRGCTAASQWWQRWCCMVLI